MPLKYLLSLCLANLLAGHCHAQRTMRLQGQYGIQSTLYYFSGNPARTPAAGEQFGLSWFSFWAGIAYDISPAWTLQAHAGLFESKLSYRNATTTGEAAIGVRKRFYAGAFSGGTRHFFTEGSGALLSNLAEGSSALGPGLGVGVEWELFNQSRLYISLNTVAGLRIGTYVAFQVGYNTPVARLLRLRRDPVYPVQSPRYHRISEDREHEE